ncbi:hypothetical protein PInf_014841 [Phytophthora infestans]|nr:hypothetical protein PInf_014841 [Phytophthora infestans]
MNLRIFFVTIVAALAATDVGALNHDQVRPFGQPSPVSISEKAAVKFKPQLHISNGCHPYPAVNAAGETSGGLATSDPRRHAVRSQWVLQVRTPKGRNRTGNTAKVNYESNWPVNHALDSTDKGGETQPLIMWDQMTDAARRSLNTVSFGSANVPMNEGNFMQKIGNASPW